MEVEVSSDATDEEVKCKELEKVTIATDEEIFSQIGVQLPLQKKEELLAFLRKNVDVFAWWAYETPGVLMKLLEWIWISSAMIWIPTQPLS